jgi:PhnB protein
MALGRWRYGGCGLYKAAFGAVERYRLEDDAGRIAVAQLAIEGADFWVQEDSNSSAQPANDRPVRMILTVDDPDAVFARAVAAGATEVFAVSEEHGWRTGRIADPFGHHWEISKPLG